MFPRRSLSFAITLGVVLLVLVTALLVGWVVLSVFNAMADEAYRPLHWTLLSVGSSVFVIIILGIVFYLTFAIKSVHLTQRQSNFIDSVTHELKSPIAALKLYLQTLNRRQLSPAERETFYKDMLEDVERLDGLVNHLLEVARLERRTADVPIEEVELANLLSECAEAACARYQAPPETVRLELSPCIAAAPREDLKIVFLNLIDNAIKYADDRPWVEVRLTLGDNGNAVATIADNGPGIPSQLRRKVFERFFRAGDELERNRPGTGLGLYLAGMLVSQLRGKIRVRESERGGAAFEVTLPAKPLSEPPVEERREEAA